MVKGQTSAFLRSEQARQVIPWWCHCESSWPSHVSCSWNALKNLGNTGHVENETKVGIENSESKSKKTQKTNKQNIPQYRIWICFFTCSHSSWNPFFSNLPKCPSLTEWTGSVVKVTVSAEENHLEGGQRSFSRMPKGNVVNQYFLQNVYNVAGSQQVVERAHGTFYWTCHSMM